MIFILVFQTNFSNANIRENVSIFTFGVQHTHNSWLSSSTKSFDNPFNFIAYTLSTRNKMIYMIISAEKSHLVIPIVEKHYCVEKIYIIGSISSVSEKISGCYYDMNEIYECIVKDIAITYEERSCDDWPSDYFTALDTQKLQNSDSVTEISNNSSCYEYIVVFYRPGWRVPDLDQKPIPVNQFTNVGECIRFIKILPQWQVFFVISCAVVPSHIQSVFDLPQICRIYISPVADLEFPSNKKKVAGIFSEPNDLVKQLYQDISFHRQQYTPISRINIFSMVDYSQKVISDLDDQQIDFLRYKLFMDILLQAPLMTFDVQELLNTCSTLFSNEGEQTAYYIDQLQDETIEMMNYIEDPKFSQVLLRLQQLDKLNELFMLQKSLIRIKQRLSQSTKTSGVLTVYMAKIISNETLERMKCSRDALIIIDTLTLTTRSLLTARTIARKMVDNGRKSILFQVDIGEGTRLLEIDSNRVMHDISAVFSLRSINLAPDGVWYARVTSADTNYQYIKKQIQHVIGAPLSWLTFGNYLHFLHRSAEGKDYFEYVLNKFQKEHVNQNSYDRHWTHAQSNSTIDDDKNGSCIIISPPTSIDRSRVLSNIADIYYQMQNYKEALKYYEQALLSSTDFDSRSHCQQRILTIKNLHEG